MTAMLPAHLTETLNNLGDAARAMTEEVRTEGARRDAEAHAREAEAREARERARKNSRFIAALLGIIVILTVVSVTIMVQNRLRSNQNAEILRQTARTSEQIADCTTVGGKCYEQGSRRQADAIRVLIRAQIYYQPCSKISDTDEEIEQCVMHRLLATASPSPTPSAPETPSPSPSVAETP